MYDVSTWRTHPGGNVLYTHAGQDATNAFVGFHSGAAYASLAQFEIGTLEGVMRDDNAFEAEVRALHPEIARLKLHTAK